MKDNFIKLFKYNDWANKKILESLFGKSVPEKVLNYFSHLLIAEKTWMIRIKGVDVPPNDFWPGSQDINFSELINKNTEDYLELIENSNDQRFNERIKYKNSKGAEFFTSLNDILTHVSMHGTYHRGQINSALRSAGFEPVNVDYITYTRTENNN